MKKRLTALLLFVVLTAVFLTFSLYSVADNDHLVVYKNDTKYSISEYPPEVKDGTLYLPLSFFVGFNSLKYEFSRETSGFYLRNENTGRFVSYAVNASGIVVDNEFENVIFPIINSTVYLPLNFTAEILSLNIEAIEGEPDRIRISDGSEKLTFKELIELYDPTITPQNPPEITPENPENPDVATDRSIYITINAYPDSATEEMLKILRNWGERATFFFTKEAIKESPETVIKAFAEGHGIALTSSHELNTLEEIKKEMTDSNRILYETLGFCTRLFRINKIIDISENELTQMGYIIWGEHETIDTQNSSAWNEAKRVYDSTFNRSQTSVSLSSHSHNTKALTQLLSFVVSDKHITAGVIDPTVEEYNFFIE